MGELWGKGLGAAVAVGLEGHHHAVEVEAGGRGEGGGHLGGMVAVVVHHGYAGDVAHVGEAAPHAAELGEGPGGLGDVEAQHPGDGEGRRGVELVVGAGVALDGHVGELAVGEAHLHGA